MADMHVAENFPPHAIKAAKAENVTASDRKILVREKKLRIEKGRKII